MSFHFNNGDLVQINSNKLEDKNPKKDGSFNPAYYSPLSKRLAMSDSWPMNLPVLITGIRNVKTSLGYPTCVWEIEYLFDNKVKNFRIDEKDVCMIKKL